MYLVNQARYFTWPHHRLTALLHFCIRACKCQLFTDEGSRSLPKRCRRLLFQCSGRSVQWTNSFSSFYNFAVVRMALINPFAFKCFNLAIECALQSITRRELQNTVCGLINTYHVYVYASVLRSPSCQVTKFSSLLALSSLTEHHTQVLSFPSQLAHRARPQWLKTCYNVAGPIAFDAAYIVHVSSNASWHCACILDACNQCSL